LLQSKFNRIENQETLFINAIVEQISIHETILHCTVCEKKYYPHETKILAPKQSKFGFDVIEYVGKNLFVECKNNDTIQNQLKGKGISISLREISYLGRKFITYLAVLHKESESAIKNLITSQGGYILHLDGTCEGDSPHLMSFIDELSSIILGNLKIPFEDSKYITPFLVEIKESYGTPFAAVHDMGAGILKAIKEVFPEIKDYICHYHFLRDIGKDLLKIRYKILEKNIKKCFVRRKLKKVVRHLRERINNETNLKEQLRTYLDLKQKTERGYLLPIEIKMYLLVSWVLDSQSESHGFGFPFDRPYVDFYCRLKIIQKEICSLAHNLSDKTILKLLPSLNKTLSDKMIANSVMQLQKMAATFDELRMAMRIALPENTKGLNDDGSNGDLEIIKKNITAFRSSEKFHNLKGEFDCYKKMIKQIDKYWEKLFADPISVKTAHGNQLIFPQRTNNILERFFRSLKSDARRKSGTKSLNKMLKAILSNTPLVKNLSNPSYLEIILGSKKTLAERFSDIDPKKIQVLLSEKFTSEVQYPKGMAALLKEQELPNLLIKNNAFLAKLT
jgi:hypothetical protein